MFSYLPYYLFLIYIYKYSGRFNLVASFFFMNLFIFLVQMDQYSDNT